MRISNNSTKRKEVYKKVSPPFGYFGSKNKLALQLCKDLPPHNCWVEAFCGSAAMTLAKPPSKIEVINDINDEIINVFLQLRNNHEELSKLIELTPYAENELYKARNTDLNNNTDIEKARIFLIKSMMAINGVFGNGKGGFSYSDSYSRNGHDARVNRWNNMPKRLNNVVTRLKGVRIEKKDARQILKRYSDRPATLVYLDPPYLTNRTNGYDNEANDLSFHTELLEIAIKSKSMVFISGYESDCYNNILTPKAGWLRKKIETTTRNVNGNDLARTEIIWMNKHFIKALNSKRVPIRLSKKEKQYGKINPKRK